jgi:hypothetical protein
MCDADLFIYVFGNTRGAGFLQPGKIAEWDKAGGVYQGCFDFACDDGFR